MAKTKGIKSRGNGQGSALHIKTNCWKAIAVVGYQNGKPIRRTKSGFKTKAEALAYIPILKKEKPQERESLRLGAAYDEWLKTIEVSTSTLNCYKAGFKLFDSLRFVPLAGLTIDELQDCLDSSGKGKRTRENAKTCLNLIYKWSIPRGYVPDNLNLAQFLKTGKDEAVKHKSGFTLEQLEAIKAAIPSLAGAKLIYCHCYLGFRPGAFLDLKKTDYHPDGNYFVGGIKTEAGIDRIVPVSPKIQPYIDELLSAPGEYVFSLNGKHLWYEKYLEIFYNVCETLGFQKAGEHTLTPHSCRHTFATLLKRADGAEKDKLSLIGHTTSSMLQYYQDVSVDDLRRVIDRI